MIGRTRPDDGASTSARLANLTARHDQALAVIEHARRTVDDAMRAYRGNRPVENVLLEIRFALNPPDRT